MNILNNRIKYFFIGFCLPLAALSTANADDTEVFYLSGDSTPKVMMILDTSLSMAFGLPDNPSSQENRVTVMKEAMVDFITNSQGINVGIMRTNQFTGAVAYPISNLDSLITEQIDRFDRPITDNRNNAVENSAGVVSITTRRNSNDGRNKVLDFKDNSYIGLRFENIVLDKDSKITRAYLQVSPYTTCSKTLECSTNDIKIEIRGEKSANSSLFSDTNQNISSRIRTNKSFKPKLEDWVGSLTAKNQQINTITTAPSNYNIEENNNGNNQANKLGDIIEEIINLDGWESGNALSLIIDTQNATTEGHGGILSAASFYGAILFVEFETATGQGNQTEITTRTITHRQKLLEELDNQQLALYTPTVPALYESIRYLTGASLVNGNNPQFNTTRSGNYKQKERVAHPASYTGGSITTPDSACQTGWLNSANCIDREIESTPDTPYYNVTISDTCEDNEASIIMLSDGAAFHPSKDINNNTVNGKTPWWNTMVSDIGDFIADNKEGTTTFTCANGGANGKAQTCGFELAEQMQAGLRVNGLTDEQTVKLFTIGFDTNTSAWLANMATKGGGTYQTATNSAGLINAFNSITGDVLSSSVTFSNTSVSLSTSNQLNHNSDLYYSLFSPSNLASWKGNLKRYKLGANGTIVDEKGVIAIDQTTGLFLSTASSYWSTTVDGSVVIEGGVAEQLQNSTQDRIIYVNHESGLITLSNSELTPNDFNLTSDADKQQYIDLMLTKKSIADPLHSTPVEVSYTDGSIIFFGDNEGYVHAIDAETGKELWAFMPKELLTNQIKIAENIETTNHIYGVDGNIVSWTDGSNKYITFGMRRGGSSYYTLNVTNRTSPSLEWKITSGDTNFTKLGQTWSTPVKTSVIKDGSVRSVLMFAGGYDTQQDNVNVRTTDNIGNSLYIIDAVTASVIYKKDDLDYSIPSDIKAIDLDGDSAAEHIYVGDMGGRLLRFTIDGSTLDYRVVANLAGDDETNNRRFYHAPDVSILSENSNSTLAVAIGSGYRSHPNDDEIHDNFYMIKQASTLPSTPKTIVESDLLESEVTIDATLLASKDGWYIPLNTTGEKALSSSTTTDGEIFFTTFEPTVDVNNCAISAGTSRLYRVSIDDGNALYQDAFPEVNDGEVDKNQSCDLSTCDDDDRFVVVEGSTILSTPVILSVGGDTSVNSGVNSIELPSRTTKVNFWRQE